MYNYIIAWNRMMGSYEYYIKQQIEKATKENAPEDVCYYNDFEQRWVTYKELSEKLQMKLDAVAEVLNQPNPASELKDGIIVTIIILLSLLTPQIL